MVMQRYPTALVCTGSTAIAMTKRQMLAMKEVQNMCCKLKGKKKGKNPNNGNGGSSKNGDVIVIASSLMYVTLHWTLYWTSRLTERMERSASKYVAWHPQSIIRSGKIMQL
jgi:hypothetical protein